MSVSIIIPTLSNFEGLKDQLRYFRDKSYEVVIVDNKPTEEKKQFVKNVSGDYKNRIVYLPQKKNLGFARAVNLGAKYADTSWILILNDDVKFEIPITKFQVINKSQISSSKLQTKENLIEKLLEFAEKYNLDAVSPVLMNPKSEVENVGYQVLPYGKIKLIRNLKVWNLVIENWKLFGNWNLEFENFRVDGLTAACLLVKTDVFKKLDGLDEEFFAYLEDVEFFLRFKKAGYRFGVAPNLEVIHNHMFTSKKMKGFKERQDLINWWRLYLKHPDKFKFNLQFVIERLRNLSGLIKKIVNL